MAKWALIILLMLMFDIGLHAQSAFETEQLRLLKEAEAVLEKTPGDADALIWKGRRLAYLGHYKKAIETYKAGEALHPKDARFARHIGHRFISLRNFKAAELAFERAARLTAHIPNQVEADGLPNDIGVPISTLKGNIWYHLGLARYLQGDYEGAARAYEGATALSHNEDAAVAARYWLYLALKRLGRDSAAAEALAPIDASWQLIENGVYHELALCLRGDVDCEKILEEARKADGIIYHTPAYGVAMARMLSGDTIGATALFTEIIAKDAGSSFGRIAAEVELAR